MEKATFGAKFRALLATGRVANLPTVWSNVLVGFGLAWLIFPRGISSLSEYATNLAFWLCLPCLIIGSSYYVAGCLLGDYVDRNHDLIHRPNRPIPSGIIGAPTVVCSAIGLFFLGTIFLLFGAPVALLIAFDARLSDIKGASIKQLLTLVQPDQILIGGILLLSIVSYALFHKRSRPLALLNMAMCRLSLAVLAIGFGLTTMRLHGDPMTFDFSWLIPFVFIPALTIAFYTFLLSSVAQTEASPSPFSYRKLLAVGTLLCPCAAILLRFLILNESADLAEPIGLISSWGSNIINPHNFLKLSSSLYMTLCIIFASLWSLAAFAYLKQSKPAYVSSALAGFCLLDACFASVFSPVLSLVCIALFCLAILLQRVAPAT